MKWRDALNSVAAAPKSSISLTSYEKGQLLAIIGVQKVYSETDVNACVEGLDAEALCGFFKTLLPVLSTPGPTVHLQPETPSPVSSTTPTTASQVARDNAEPLKDFDEWVKSHPSKKFTSIEDLHVFLQRAPIPAEVYEFVRNHLLCVPKGGGHLHTVESAGGTCFLREDYFVRLANLGKQGTKVVMFSGRKRFGKSVALPHELVRARKAILGVRDQAVFFYPGYGHISESCFPTVIRLLAHMRIPALFDEFIDVTSVDISKAYNVLLDAKQEIEPLSAVLFGSDEVSIWNKGFWFERAGVAICERLPAPPLSVMYQMLRFKEPGLQGCPLGLRFLTKMALYGYDLSAHMDSDPSDSFKTLKKTGMQAFGSFYGGYLTALERLIKNSNFSAGTDSYNLSNLEKSEYVIRRRNGPLVYDFLNPQTVAYQAALLDLSEEEVEERVLQQLLRQRKHLLDELLDQLGIPTSGEEVLNNMWCGTFSKESKADMLFFHGDEAFLVSAKRAQGAQEWQSCFVRVLDSIGKEWKHLDKELCGLLVAATKLRLVAVSASDEGRIGGTQPLSYSPSIVTDLKPKRVTCERVSGRVMQGLPERITRLPILAELEQVIWQLDVP
ncbi:hypothetical protein GOP47_0001612 [Adiantum capillus-veneris]|uniref:Uncharacterized protein n=1 Tax=Adiantum capillus-veneris TaxID=13818 RepID=A0A9D4V8Q0_ADICA|nr:hypothetical protein GOP47_0001612 [Adiantum capillus-veneris]